MGPRKCGPYIAAGLQIKSFIGQNVPLFDQLQWSYNEHGLKTQGIKHGPLCLNDQLKTL